MGDLQQLEEEGGKVMGRLLLVVTRTMPVLSAALTLYQVAMIVKDLVLDRETTKG